VLLDVLFATRGDSYHQYRHSREEWKALLDYLESVFLVMLFILQNVINEG